MIEVVMYSGEAVVPTEDPLMIWFDVTLVVSIVVNANSEFFIKIDKFWSLKACFENNFKLILILL